MKRLLLLLAMALLACGDTAPDPDAPGWEREGCAPLGDSEYAYLDAPGYNPRGCTGFERLRGRRLGL